MLAERGLARTVDVASCRDGIKARLRWQAERPGALWHGDVCHGPTLKLEGRRVPIRVHGLLDDASRHVDQRCASYSDEREAHHAHAVCAGPDGARQMRCLVYLDNGVYLSRATILRAGAARASGSRCFTRKPVRRARPRQDGALLAPHARGSAVAPGTRSHRWLRWRSKLRHWLVRYYQCSPHAGLLGRDAGHMLRRGREGARHRSRSCVRR